MADLTKAAGKDHKPGGGARYLAEREGSCFVFGRELLSWALSTVCWWIVLAGGDAGLGFSKDKRPQHCGSLKRSCCHALTQETDVYAPAQGRGHLFLAGLNPPLLLSKGSPSVQVRVGCKCCLPEGCVPMLVLVSALLLQCYCDTSAPSSVPWPIWQTSPL